MTKKDYSLNLRKEIIDLMDKTTQILKKDNLRYSEYYDMQDTFDELYRQSKNNSIFTKLYNIITSNKNILLAYRTIKRNNGSNTAGVNNHTIKNWEKRPLTDFLKYIKKRFENYKPQTVRRVMIPKPNGKERPLGIPCIEDRIIQQCIKQVLEPICEAKFHPHSYGFRPNRNTEHAIAYLNKKINLDKFYYIVDIDIKGFFDNVNHGKLLKQIWTLGIRDKKVISIITAMLKAPIKGEGIPQKGVPQGGILSPLLANIVLNELDWWISSQWETFKSNHKYSGNDHKIRALRNNSKLKEIYIVRYADDFKILCKDKRTAKIMFIAIQKWLKERLQLEISQEKSKITNVKKEYTEYLGFKIKTVIKRHKHVVNSHITDKAKTKIYNNLKNQIKKIQKSGKDIIKETNKLNSMILGIQNYYKIATQINIDLVKIHYNISKVIQNRLKSYLSKKEKISQTYEKLYKGYKFKKYNIKGITIFPIGAIKTKNPMNLKKDICSYTKAGRELIHQNLNPLYYNILHYLMENPNEERSIEYNDNRLSKYTAQKGKCPISGEVLGRNLNVHHIIPLSKGGTDEYKNLILIPENIHKLIHINDENTIKLYLNTLNMKNTKVIDKINKYRKKVGNNEIIIEH